MRKRSYITAALLITALLVGLTGCSGSKSSDNTSEGKKEVSLLNVSYDPTREFYAEYNVAFAKYYEEKTGVKVSVEQSHGGSGKQARGIIEGLEADVATLALAYDIDQIADAGLLEEDWESKFENNSAPYTSTIVFLVRKGNPKNIKDWDDLIKDDVSVITPNPKTSGGARWNYLAAWGYASELYNGDEAKIKDFVQKLYANVEVLDSGARGATTTFTENGIGDVLIAWENEAYLAVDELGADKYEIVVPSISILAEPSVAVVSEYAKDHGTEEVAKEYIQYLYSEEGQEIAAKNYYRPRMESVAKKYKDTFKEVKLFTLADKFGTWRETQEKHFADGGIFDQLYENISK
jgi:sulfate/thiosulfate transport system substrate-binding protein